MKMPRRVEAEVLAENGKISVSLIEMYSGELLGEGVATFEHEPGLPVSKAVSEAVNEMLVRIKEKVG